MTNSERAVQFMPFAALKGYEERIDEAGQQSQTPIILASDAQEALNARLAKVLEQPDAQRVVSITCFREEGTAMGEYDTVSGVVCGFDSARGVLAMGDGTQVSLASIVDIRW